MEKLKSIPPATIATLAYRAGLLGSGSILLGVVISALAFSGRAGERYAFQNHFVSELGEVGISQASWAFNVGIFLGGLLLMIFMLGLAWLMQHWIGWVFAALAVYAGVNGMLVGVYPMNNFGPHVKVAMAFFNTGTLVMLAFSIYTLLSNNPWFATKLAIPGGLTMIFFIVFLAFPDPAEATGAAPDLEAATLAILANRPAVLPLAIFEWLIIFGILAWVITVSLHLRQGCVGGWNSPQAD